MVTWSWEQVICRRLRRSHLLVRRPADDVLHVVGSVCGVQAQVPAAAELCLAVRTEGLSRARVRRLVDEERTLTRTYAMRDTAHLLRTEELPLYHGAMRQLLGGAGWFTRFGLDADRAERLFGGIADILEGRRLNRRELAEDLRERVGSWVFDAFDPTLGQLSLAASYAGVMAYGPPHGSTSTFVRPDHQASRWREVDDDTALRELVRRFFSAYGPATAADLARWLRVPIGQARECVAALGSELEPLAVEGAQAWVPTGDVDAEDPSTLATMRLLPRYDCYILGSGPITRIAPAPVQHLLRAHAHGRFEGAAGLRVLLVDGLVAGVWEGREVRSGLELAVESIRPLLGWQMTELEAEAQRLAEFDGLKVSLSVATTRP